MFSPAVTAALPSKLLSPSTVAGLPFTFTVDNGLICRTTDRQHPCPSLPGGELIDGPTNALFALGKKRFFTVAPLASRSSALVLRCDPACPKAFLRLPLLRAWLLAAEKAQPLPELQAP